MGNDVSLDVKPLDIQDLGNEVKIKPKSKYMTNIKVWEVRDTVKNINFEKFNAFTSKSNYIVLCLNRDTERSQKSNESNSTQNSSEESLFEVCQSATDNLTPRGLNSEFYRSMEYEGNSFQLFLWNGRKASKATQAVSLVACYEIEELLNDENIENFMDNGSPEPISKYYKTDVIDASQLYAPELYEALLKNCSLINTYIQKRNNSELLTLSNLFQDLFQEENEQKKNKRKSSTNSTNSSSSMMGSPLGMKIPNMKQLLLRKTSRPTSPRSPHFARPLTRKHSFSSTKSPGRMFPPLSPINFARKESDTIKISGFETVSSRSNDSSSRGFHGGKSGSSSSNDPSTPRSIPNGNEQVAYYRKICSQVRKDIFLGSDFVARSKELLQKNGITHIVNAARVACGNYFPNDFKYYTLNLYDSPSQSIIGLFFKVIKFMDDAINNGGKVYVHCYQGVSRSSSIVVAYLIWKEKMGCRSLLEDVKLKRPVSSPNAGFTVQLFRWEKILQQKSTETYMYRLSPLNDRYKDHKQTGPQLCYISKLDTRTSFILQDSEGQIYIWNGLKRKENLKKDAVEFANLMVNMLENIKKDFIILEEGEETEKFKDALSKIITPDSMKKIVNVENPYPELDDFDKELSSVEVVEPVIEIEQTIEEDDEQEEEAKLYVYPDWELLSTFDSDDLMDDQVFVLEPVNEEKIYIWIGSDSKDYDSQDIGKRFIQDFKKTEDTEIIITTRDEEPSEFWNYFVNG